MRLKTVGSRTILTDRVWPAHILLAVLGVGAMVMAFEGWRQGLSGSITATLMGGLGMMMLLPLGLGQRQVVFDREARIVRMEERGLLGESRRMSFDDIAEVAVITCDTDEGIDYTIGLRRKDLGQDLRFGSFRNRARADEIAAVLNKLL